MNFEEAALPGAIAEPKDRMQSSRGTPPEVQLQSPRTALLGLGLESIGSPQKLEILLAGSMLMC